MPELSKFKTRGYLPHFNSYNVAQHLIIHQADSIPLVSKMKLKDGLDSDAIIVPNSYFQRLLDSGYGTSLFNNAKNADRMREIIFHFHGVRYEISAFVIMPNHIHVLLIVFKPWSLSQVVASWKKYSSRTIDNPVDKPSNGRRLWHSEYFDRYMRNSAHFEKTVDYIHYNPVKAGLVENPEDWRWSSYSCFDLINSRA